MQTNNRMGKGNTNDTDDTNVDKTTLLGGWLAEREKAMTKDKAQALRFVRTTLDLMSAFAGPKEAQILLCVLCASGRVAANAGKSAKFVTLSMMGVQSYQMQHGEIADDDQKGITRCATQVETALRILWDLSEIKKVDVETGEIWFRTGESGDGREWYGVQKSVNALTEGATPEDVKIREFLTVGEDKTMPQEVRESQTAILKRVFEHAT